MNLGKLFLAWNENGGLIQELSEATGIDSERIACEMARSGLSVYEIRDRIAETGQVEPVEPRRCVNCRRVRTDSCCAEFERDRMVRLGLIETSVKPEKVEVSCDGYKAKFASVPVTETGFEELEYVRTSELGGVKASRLRELANSSQREKKAIARSYVGSRETDCVELHVERAIHFQSWVRQLVKSGLWSELSRVIEGSTKHELDWIGYYMAFRRVGESDREYSKRLLEECVFLGEL